MCEPVYPCVKLSFFGPGLPLFSPAAGSSTRVGLSNCSLRAVQSFQRKLAFAFSLASGSSLGVFKRCMCWPFSPRPRRSYPNHHSENDYRSCLALWCQDKHLNIAQNVRVGLLYHWRSYTVILKYNFHKDIETKENHAYVTTCPCFVLLEVIFKHTSTAVFSRAVRNQTLF